MRPNKALGQHFLRDPEVLEDIARIVDPASARQVIEIGPGEGALTAWLVGRGADVVALEKDPRAVEAVRARLGDRVRVVEGDATGPDLDALAEAAGADVVLAGNLPYNAGAMILRRILALPGGYARAVLMFQHEVAARIAAAPDSRVYGIPSVLTQVRARASLVLDVPPEAFSPPPKVDSAVILLEPLPAPLVPAERFAAFERFLDRAFAMRRKTLSNVLKDARPAMERLGIDPQARAETLSPQRFVALWEAIEGA
jgi:16S rRNA (adenine1518-N6/adenine1519-N6)-dimethyltransferase